MHKANQKKAGEFQPHLVLGINTRISVLRYKFLLFTWFPVCRMKLSTKPGGASTGLHMPSPIPSLHIAAIPYSQNSPLLLFLPRFELGARADFREKHLGDGHFGGKHAL